VDISSIDESGRTSGGDDESHDDLIAPATGERACLPIPSKDEFKIADYRKSIGMTQIQFAKAYDISLGTLRKWESDSSSPIFGEPFQRIFFDWLGSWLKKAYS